jgi:hypothetical protein
MLQNTLGLSRARNDPGRTTPFHLKALQGVKIPADRQSKASGFTQLANSFGKGPLAGIRIVETL